MAIVFTCPCGLSYNVDESLAGRQAHCRSCGRFLVVPDVSGPGIEVPPPTSPQVPQPMEQPGKAVTQPTPAAETPGQVPPAQPRVQPEVGAPRDQPIMEAIVVEPNQQQEVIEAQIVQEPPPAQPPVEIPPVPVEPVAETPEIQPTPQVTPQVQPPPAGQPDTSWNTVKGRPMFGITETQVTSGENEFREVTSIQVLHLSLFLGIIGFVLGLIAGIIFILATMVNVPKLVSPKWLLISVGGLIFGFLSGAVSGLVYNLLAPKIGGIVISFKRISEEQQV